MSLRDDFNMYYGGTWIGYRPEGSETIYPFHVQEVGFSTRRFNPRTEAERYGAEAMNALSFSGYYVRNGEAIPANGVFGDGRFMLENPELGYFLINGTKRWTSFRPHRSTKKGICSRRVHGWPVGRTREYEFLEGLYLAVSRGDDPNSRLFDMRSESLHYKGRRIGRVEGQTITVDAGYNHVKPFILKAFPDYNFGE